MKRLSRTATSTFLAGAIVAASMAASIASAKDKVIIISPHRKSIQEEFVPAFTEYYKTTFKSEVEVEWIDQGGTSDDIRFVRAKFQGNPKSSGIDIFWGGGSATFTDLAKDKILEPIKLSAALQKEIPATAGGVPLFDKPKTWYASAMSSFGIFYNKATVKMSGLAEPTTWTDLADPKYNDRISLTDPRRSGTASSMNSIILQNQGWDKGWQTLMAISANTKQFTHSSSDPIKAIVSGEADASMAIDFYALAKVGDIGTDKLGFTLPKGQTIIDPDPVAILKGAPNRVAAERFVEWVLSAEAQNLLILPKGAVGGPKQSSLGRMAVNTRSYTMTEGKRTLDTNPFAPTTAKDFFKFDSEKAAKLKRPLDDLVGAIIVDTHGDLKAAWKRIIADGSKPEALAALAKPPVTEAELTALDTKWDDNVARNEAINKWVAFAKNKYAALAAGKTSEVSKK